MAELLTKEKQFIKLNQELDRLTGTTGNEKGALKSDNRFQTFQKSRGPSTILRKQLPGGDSCKRDSNVLHGIESRGEAGDNFSNTRPNNGNVLC